MAQKLEHVVGCPCERTPAKPIRSRQTQAHMVTSRWPLSQSHVVENRLLRSWGHAWSKRFGTNLGHEVATGTSWTISSVVWPSAFERQRGVVCIPREAALHHPCAPTPCTASRAFAERQPELHTWVVRRHRQLEPHAIAPLDSSPRPVEAPCHRASTAWPPRRTSRKSRPSRSARSLRARRGKRALKLLAKLDFPCHELRFHPLGARKQAKSGAEPEFEVS